jgi:CO dehydrogenase nickel-insertion accessory protein CooC1
MTLNAWLKKVMIIVVETINSSLQTALCIGSLQRKTDCKDVVYTSIPKTRKEEEPYTKHSRKSHQNIFIRDDD